MEAAKTQNVPALGRCVSGVYLCQKNLGGDYVS